MVRNLLGTDQLSCSTDPITGFYRDGCCTPRRPAGPRRLAVRLAGAALVVALVVAGCGSDPAPVRTEQAERPEVESYPLPLGLAQVEGTEPVGRPLVFEQVAAVLNGQPIASTAVRAAYRVTGDAEAVLRSWAEQLVSLGMGDVLLRLAEPVDSPSAWGEIGNRYDWDASSPGPGFLDVQLWATEAEPILLVSIDRHQGVEGVPSTLVDDGGSLEPAPDPLVGAEAPDPGEELFDEQGDVIRVPEGARALMPMIPTTRGTGGSTSVLAATDEAAVIQRMLDEAVAQNEYHEVGAVEVQEQGDVIVTKGRFVVPAGGWDLQIVAVRVPGEADAVLWVQSAAD